MHPRPATPRERTVVVVWDARKTPSEPTVRRVPARATRSQTTPYPTPTHKSNPSTRKPTQSFHPQSGGGKQQIHPPRQNGGGRRSVKCVRDARLDATLKVRGRLRMHGRQRGVHNQHPPQMIPVVRRQRDGPTGGTADRSHPATTMPTASRDRRGGLRRHDLCGLDNNNPRTFSSRDKPG
jgi:hypothetical protein